MSLTSQGRRLHFPLLALLDGQGIGTVGDRGVEVGISSPLFLSLRFRFPCQERVFTLAPPSPGFYSHLFVLWGPSGLGRLVIVLSRLYEFCCPNSIRVRVQSLTSLTPVTAVPFREAAGCFPSPCRITTFRSHFIQTASSSFALFSLSTAPLFLTRVLAPLSVGLSILGIRLLQYLDVC